jgi:hypothetical protein
MPENNIHKYDQVTTSDNVELGKALRIHHWPADADPALIQYPSYLEVWSINLGGHVFIPTEFIDQAKAGIVILAVPLATVQRGIGCRISSPDASANVRNFQKARWLLSNSCHFQGGSYANSRPCGNHNLPLLWRRLPD